MKHNWKYKTLGETCTVIGGHTPKTDNPKYWNGSYNWFTPAEINEQKYYTTSERKITEEGAKSVGLTLMPKGTVLLTSRAPIGKVGIALEDCYCNQGFKCLICNTDVLNEFLYYALIYFNKDIKEKGTRVTFKEIYKSTTESISLPFPPKAFQQVIADELNLINLTIAKCKTQIRDLEELALAIFYDIFGIPSDNPYNWPIHTLKSLVIDKLTYGSGASGIPFDNILRYIRITDIDENGRQKADNICSPSIYDSKYDLQEGDILFARSGATVGKSFLYKKKYGKSIYAGYLIKARLNQDQILPIYLYYLTKTPYYWDYIKKSIAGVAQPNVNAQKYGNFEVSVPPLSLQEKFEKQIEIINKLIEKTYNQINDLKTLFDAEWITGLTINISIYQI